MYKTIKILTLIFSISLFSFSTLIAQDNDVVEVNPYKKLTKKFIGAIKQKKPYKNYHFFDTSIYGRMTEADVDRKLQRFEKKHGDIVAIEKTVLDTQGCKMATCTSIKVKGGKFLWYVYFDQGSDIIRFEIDTFIKDKQWFYIEEPQAKINYTKEEVLIRTSGFIMLPGTYYKPSTSSKHPLVILVHGSGPHDRDETMGKNKVFRDIAVGLAQKGIGVLAYDKRTYVYQFNNPFPIDSMDYYTETVEDAVEAFIMSKKLKGVDTTRIFAAGHSLGGGCGPLIAKDCKGLKGLILLAAPARGMLEILPEQVDYIASLPGKNKEEAERVSTAIKWQVNNALSPDLNLKTKKMLPFGARPKYWLFDRAYKPVEEAKKLSLPILLIQGGRDYNVTKKDYDLWVSGLKDKSNFKAIWIENVDHLFFEGNGKAKPDDYLEPNHVSKSVITEMENFIKLK